MGDGSREDNYGFSTSKGYVYVWDEPRDKITPQRMLIHRPINPIRPANERWTTEDQRNCHLRGLAHDPARQGISTSNLGLSTTLTPILQL